VGEREALYRAVIENPADDAPRLVFADWLEEHGEAQRAEFIRLQIGMAKLAMHDPRWQPLVARAEKLARGKKRLWQQNLPQMRGVIWEGFSRGFPSTVRFSNLLVFQDHIGAVVAAAPVTHVSFTPHSVAVSLEALAISPHLAGITELELSYLAISDDILTPLLDARHLGRLRSLALSDNRLTNVGIIGLCRCQAFPSLRHLSLIRNVIGPEVVDELIGSPWMRTLDELWIDAERLGRRGAAKLKKAFGQRVQFPVYRWR
jgi:uncharacterized protein (TIGR02996 family)